MFADLQFYMQSGHIAYHSHILRSSSIFHGSHIFNSRESVKKYLYQTHKLRLFFTLLWRGRVAKLKIVQIVFFAQSFLLLIVRFY